MRSLYMVLLFNLCAHTVFSYSYCTTVHGTPYLCKQHSTLKYLVYTVLPFNHLHNTVLPCSYCTRYSLSITVHSTVLPCSYFTRYSHSVPVHCRVLPCSYCTRYSHSVPVHSTVLLRVFNRFTESHYQSARWTFLDLATLITNFYELFNKKHWLTIPLFLCRWVISRSFVTYSIQPAL